MEKRIAFVCLAAWSVQLENFAINVDVAYVEQFVIFESILASSRKIGLDIIEFAESPCKSDVTLVVEVGTSENENSILVTRPSKHALNNAQLNYLCQSGEDFIKDLVRDRGREIDTTDLGRKCRM